MLCLALVSGNSLQQLILCLRWLGQEFTHSSDYVANIRRTSNTVIHHLTKVNMVSKTLRNLELVSINNSFVTTTFLKDRLETSIRERRRILCMFTLKSIPNMRTKYTFNVILTWYHYVSVTCFDINTIEINTRSRYMKKMYLHSWVVTPNQWVRTSLKQ